jgi:multidrug efflux pump subunit AcrA (membrane-fusion protein)
LQDGKNGAADVIRFAVRDERDFLRKALIDFIDREVQPLGEVRLRVLVSNVDRSLRPGLQARVQIQAGAPEDSIVVPDSSLIEQNGRRYVCVLAEDNTIVRRFVETAERVDDLRMIERGLSVNDWVLESRINPALIGSKLSEQAILRVDAAAKPPVP